MLEEIKPLVFIVNVTSHVATLVLLMLTLELLQSFITIFT